MIVTAFVALLAASFVCWLAKVPMWADRLIPILAAAAVAWFLY